MDRPKADGFDFKHSAPNPSRQEFLPPGLPLGPDSLSARVLGQPAIMLGGPRALLLELAHPVVAAGVVKYSGFEKRPWDRLISTVRTMDAITFGPPSRSVEAARKFREHHERMTVTDGEGIKHFASDPQLLLWVHATLVDTVLAVEKRHLGMLTRQERESYYKESILVALACGIPKGLVPPNLSAFEVYMADMLECLSVGEDARRVAGFILHPPLDWQLRPVTDLASAGLGFTLASITADLLPKPIRHAYHLDTLAIELAAPGVGVTSGISRALSPRLPPSLLKAFARVSSTLLLSPGRLPHALLRTGIGLTEFLGSELSR